MSIYRYTPWGRMRRPVTLNKEYNVSDSYYDPPPLTENEDQRDEPDEYRCQFCGEVSAANLWANNKCPDCKRAYDPMLAQEGDD